MNSEPIGVFDSGIGGLTILKESIRILEKEDFIYYADLAHCPYGLKSKEFIQERSFEVSKLLISKGAKAIVVACNTATSAAITELRAHFNIPFVGIEPAIKPAAKKTKTGKIGVLATRQTLNGSKFKDISDKYAKNVELLIQVGDGLVELVESGNWETPEGFDLVKKYVQPLLDSKVDQIILGCTHYPFLIPVIEKIINGNAEVINPAPAVARQLKKVLEEGRLLNKSKKKGKLKFLASGGLVNEKFISRLLSDFSFDIKE
ncbi:MAG: glutamate racemase [Bacteroidota bacterium]